MKYVVIILGGGADKPLDELDGLTPLEAADTPNLDRLARAGRIGTVATTPKGFGAGADVCVLDLLGYEPGVYHNGRAPFEAVGMGVEADPEDWILCLNLVTVGAAGTDQEGLMLDHSAGAIPDAEARVLLKGLAEFWAEQEPGVVAEIELSPRAGYRSILVDRSGRDYSSVECTAPHEILDRPWQAAMPRGGKSDEGAVLSRLMRLSHEYLSGHEVNLARVEQGLRPANMAWIWGQGTSLELPSFESRFGLRGGMIASGDLLSGISKLMGMDLVNCPRLTGFHDTDYGMQGKVAVDSIRKYDIVCCHVNAPDEASHHADYMTKVASLASIDREIIGPVMKAVERHGDPAEDPKAEGWRVLVLPDHYTLCSTRKHDAAPVPFAMGGAWVQSVVHRVLTEKQAGESDLHINPGSDLMEYFLHSGLVRIDTK